MISPPASQHKSTLEDLRTINLHFQAMEFHSLTRRELQSLCKMNKIPANMTNVAMADALKSLELVEGIEEISQPKESESAQSSIESPAISEHVPPTGGRTSRQRTIPKEEPKTLQSLTRTRGTARKTQAKSKEDLRADATETPAAAAQPSRRRFPVTSACRKMETQLKECAEEDEKKGVPLTPVALQVTSRRRGLKKESEVRRVYSTRRSARLAEKNVHISSELKNEEPEILRRDLFMKEGEKVEINVKEVTDGVHKVSEITGVEVETSLEENFKKMDGTEVSSGKKQGISDENDETKLESNVEDKLSQNSDTDDPKLEIGESNDAGDEQLSVRCEKGSRLDGERADETEPSSGGNITMTLNESCVEEILSQHSETDEPKPEVDLCIVDAGAEQSSVLHGTGSELNGERADETKPSNGGNVAMTLNESTDFEDGDGSPDICIFESKSGFENTTEFTTHKDADEADLTDTIDHGVKNISLENIDDVMQDEVGEKNETNLSNEVDDGVKQASEEELLGKTLCSITENTQNERNIIDAEEVSESALTSINWQLNCSESAVVDSPLHLNADFLESNVEERQDEVGDEKESNPTKHTRCVVQKPVGKILGHEVENLRTEASEKAQNDVASSDAVENVLPSLKNPPTKHFGRLERAATVHSPMHQNADFLKEIKTSGVVADQGISIPPIFTEIDSCFTTRLKSLTPTEKSASKASATVKKIACVSDNKENIGSCDSKLVITTERVKIAKDIAENVDKNMDLTDISLRKLTKMLKEKLQITNKSSKDENGNKVITRPALQALHENSLGNETES